MIDAGYEQGMGNPFDSNPGFKKYPEVEVNFGKAALRGHRVHG